MTTPATVTQLRRLLLALLAFGLLGTGVELVLLGHYEDSWQVVPLVVVLVACFAVSGHLMRDSHQSVRILRGSMLLLILAGVIGVVLHYRGNLEFQVDMDPTASRWVLFTRVIRAKAPPALAPGALAQLGLLGLVSTYQHPATRSNGHSTTTGASL